MPSSTRMNRLAFAATLLAVASSSVQAIGDFPCSGSSDSQSCSAWSTDADAQGVISATAVCQPDPINTSVSYCGYAKATCSSNDDCDYGSCGSDGRCAGYLGDTCTQNTDCQAFFFCGTDGTCGGTGAACANGDPSSPIPNPEQQCVSQSCDTTTQTCAAPPSAGVSNGFGCSNNAMCASGYCSSASICAAQASQAGGSRKKRSIDCPAHQTACAVGSTGFECIDTQTNLEQCGGCVTDGSGQDCTAIHGAEGVECSQGRCLVLSCVPGLNVNAQGTACL